MNRLIAFIRKLSSWKNSRKLVGKFPDDLPEADFKFLSRIATFADFSKNPILQLTRGMALIIPFTAICAIALCVCQLFEKQIRFLECDHATLSEPINRLETLWQ